MLCRARYRQVLLRQPGKAEDAGEGLVYLVCNASGKLADRREPVGVAELFVDTVNPADHQDMACVGTTPYVV